MSLDLNLAGRQGCNWERRRAGATRLHSRAAAIKKRERKKEREAAGSRESRKQPTAQGLGQKRWGAVCYWKSWQESKTAERREKERGGCLTLTWSVKASCSFIAATQSHFYLPDTPQLWAELSKRQPDVKCGIRSLKELRDKEKKMVSLVSLPSLDCFVSVLLVWLWWAGRWAELWVLLLYFFIKWTNLKLHRLRSELRGSIWRH